MRPRPTTLGELVTVRPGAARVLERYRLDYCCGGARTLTEACEAAGVDPDEVDAALEAATPLPTPDWATMSPARLADHIEAVHHTYLRSELPRLGALAAKVRDVHGGRHPELVEVAALFDALRADLEPHLHKEELVLFPRIRALDEATPAPGAAGPVGPPIRVMRAEHDAAGDLLARLRLTTADYTVPDDGCASYLALYEGLAELEADTHLHVHKENNVLFPAAEALEQR
jgi:regulator of cell morphogenesis and NO signaling